MPSDFMTLYALTVLFAYFLFLTGIGIATLNGYRVPKSDFMEDLVRKFPYNLRDIPRINYKEPSSDEDLSDSSEKSERSHIDNAYNGTSELVKNRRDRNAMSRILDTD